MSFPRKRNFILILAMWAGLVVRPNGTANNPLELNMYFVPSWLPAPRQTVFVREIVRQGHKENTNLVNSSKIQFALHWKLHSNCTYFDKYMTATFRVGESDFLSSPKTQISPLQLLRHQSIELLRRAETCSHLRHREKTDITDQTTLTQMWTLSRNPLGFTFDCYFTSTFFGSGFSASGGNYYFRSNLSYLKMWFGLVMQNQMFLFYFIFYYKDILWFRLKLNLSK